MNLRYIYAAIFTDTFCLNLAFYNSTNAIEASISVTSTP